MYLASWRDDERRRLALGEDAQRVRRRIDAHADAPTIQYCEGCQSVMKVPLCPEELLALAYDDAPFATIIVSSDWRVLHWGAAAQLLYGWTASEAEGEPLELLTGAGGGRRGLRLREMAAAQPAGACEAVMRRHKDGRLMHVEVSWRSVRNIDGTTRCHVVSKRDVTQEQLRRDIDVVTERYRDLLDSVPDAIVMANEVGSIVLFNAEAARLFGVSAGSMIGRPVECLIPERFARGHALHRERFASEPQRRPMGSGLELRARRGDDSEFPVEVSLSPLVLDDRRFVMAALRDRTERIRLEEVQQAITLAQKASTAKTEFLSRMSHELRTPLNAMLGFAQVLGIDSGKRLDVTQHRQIEQIVRAGRHLLALMNDLLDVTRIETGALALSLEPVEVAGVLDEVVAICEAVARDSVVNVDFRVEPADVHVQADRLRLRQVMLNLVTNGIKYNRRGGRVDIRVSVAGSEVTVTVRDTGVGLSAEQLGRLYRPFDRLGAETGQVEGTGIGLVIARGLVQGMGGRLDAESEPGTGSAFSVRLPLAEAPHADKGQLWSGRATAADIIPSADVGRWGLLCVEDNEANIEVVRAVMALRPQWRLALARSGAAAMRASNDERPDAMVVDMHLPDIDGLELARRWNADPSMARVSKAGLSADATIAAARAAAAHGFDPYFTKPLDVKAFFEWLDTLEARLRLADPEAPTPRGSLPSLEP